MIDQILRGTIWSARFPVNRTERLARLAHPRHDPVPKKSGVYRIHMEGVPILAYVGQSQDLRRRINELRGIEGDSMPFTDPHIASPCLWVWKQFPPNRPYTVSFAAIEGSAYWRQGFEDLVIAQARWNLKRALTLDERWHTAYSPLANFHKMPDGWVSSSSRAKGYRGGRVPFRTESHTPSIMPVGELDDQRDPIADLGWGGHEWTPWRRAGEVQVDERAQGLYRLRKSDENDLIFIGYGSIGDAMRDARSAGRDLMVSYVVGPWCYHEQLELVTDALGLYLCQTGNLPHVQYGGEENKRAGSSWLLSSLTTQVICALFRPASAQSLRLPEMAIA